MDVVYVVRPGDDNEELRYSLRSLINLPHDRVWIVGHKPPWVVSVDHIPTTQCGSSYTNSTANLRTACETGAISDEFVYMNDDFFIMRPLQDVPTLHRGPLDEVLAAHPVDNSYRRGMAATGRLLATLGHRVPLSYELHMPMVVDRARMVEVLDVGHRVRGVLHKRTLYGNHWRIGGAQVDDCKVKDHERDWSPDAVFLSTNDASFRVCEVGEHIRKVFDEPGPYEVR